MQNSQNPVRKLGIQNSGAMSILYALIMTSIVVIVGFSLNMRNNVNVKNVGQLSLDSATLSYLRTYILTGSEVEGQAAARAVFYANAELADWTLNLNPVVERDGELVASGKAEKPVDVLEPGVGGRDSSMVGVISETAIPIRDITAVVVPDVSWSMRGAPIAAVQDAMEIFGEKMYSLPRAFSDRLNMSIVPYAGSVNVEGSANDVTSLLRSWEYGSPDLRYQHKRHYTNNSGCNSSHLYRHREELLRSGRSARYRVHQRAWEKRTVEERERRTDDDGNEYWVVTNRYDVWECNDKGVVRTEPWSGCLQTRQAEFNPTNVLVPNGSMPLPATLHGTTTIPHCPANTSSVRVKIRNVSDYRSITRRLTLGFSTAHDIGLLWGTRILEPRWASYFGLASQPWNNEQYPKYLVFLSDGASVAIGHTINDYSGRNKAQIERNVTDLCNYLKRNGVTIYGISYARNNRPDALEVVQNCASPDKHFLGMSTNIEEIFEKIAFEIRTKELRISD